MGTIMRHATVMPVDYFELGQSSVGLYEYMFENGDTFWRVVSEKPGFSMSLAFEDLTEAKISFRRESDEIKDH